MKDTATTDNELLIPEVNIVAQAYDADEKITAIIEAIEKDVKAEVYTVETAVGRKRIASQSYKISRSKTAMDKVGADLIEEANKLVKTINGRRNIVKTRFDTLRDEIRKPLTEWEERDNQRKTALVERINTSFGLRVFPVTSAELRALQDATIAIELDESWQEYLEDATKAKDAFLRLLAGKITDAQRIEEREAQLERERQAQAEELARLREAEAQRQADAEAAAEIQRKADEEKAKADAQIAALKAELEAMRQQPLPEPLGVTGSKPGMLIVDEVSAEPVKKIDTPAPADEVSVGEPVDHHNPLGIGRPPRAAIFTKEEQITAAVLAVIIECETQEAAAAEIASAICAGQIPHVKATF